VAAVTLSWIHALLLLLLLPLLPLLLLMPLLLFAST